MGRIPNLHWEGAMTKPPDFIPGVVGHEQSFYADIIRAALVRGRIGPLIILTGIVVVIIVIIVIIIIIIIIVVVIISLRVVIIIAVNRR